MSRKVIIAGPDILFDFFKANMEDWDCQTVCPTVEDIWGGLESGSLDDESEIVLLCDVLYEGNEDAFAEVAANLAPNALLLILSYDREVQEDINNSILAQPANLQYRSETGQNVPFHFIWHGKAIVAIDDVIYAHDNGDHDAQEFRDEQPTVVPDSSTAHHAFDKKGMVITCTSSKGGSGKSTVALLLATQMAASSKKAHEKGLIDEPLKICVVDLDTFDGQLGFVLNQAVPTALNIALSSLPRDEDLIWNNLVYSERMGFHALLAPNRGSTAHYTDSRFYTEVIGYLKTMFDVVLLDTSVQHYDEIISEVALPLSDAILLITTLDIKSVKGLARWMKTAEEPVKVGGHGLDMSKIGIVVNGSVQGVNIGKDELTTAAMNAPLLVSIPLDTVAVQVAGNSGRLEEIVHSHPHLGNAYLSLANKFAKPLNTMFEPIIVDDDSPVEISPTRSKPAIKPGKKRKFFGR